MTQMEFLLNYADATHDYANYNDDYIIMDLSEDYLIWTKGDATVKDLMTAEPTPGQLNNASTVIDEVSDVTVEKCLLFDYSHDVGGAYYTHLVKGMGENARYVFGFKFDGPTATEPQLEAWDDENHDSTDKQVLGAGTPANSMIKTVCTTDTLPGALWAGYAIAGSGRVLLLNNGNGAVADPGSGNTSELYANIKIVIPAGHATPAVETFILTVRYCYN